MSNRSEFASYNTADGPGEDNPGGWAGTGEAAPLRERGIEMVPIHQPTAYLGNARTREQVRGSDHQGATTGESH
jgi:hypothetical protein